MKEPRVGSKWIGNPSPLLGLLVAWPVILVFWYPLWSLTAAVALWALVYALLPRRADRWPWWVLGQWLTLTVVFSNEFFVMEDAIGFIVARAGAISAVLGLMIWMGPVAIAELHRTQWHTRRPTA